MTRGLGDSMALRKACHDAEIHAMMSPQGDDARAVFDAVEQARVESIGANRMAGMAENLEIDARRIRLQKANFSAVTSAKMRRLKRRWPFWCAKS